MEQHIELLARRRAISKDALQYNRGSTTSSKTGRLNLFRSTLERGAYDPSFRAIDNLLLPCPAARLQHKKNE